MKRILPLIIGPDQKGFIKGRYIGENTRLLYDVMDYLISKNRSGLLLMVDFEKAFDSLEHKYVRKALKAYNFGNDFIRWFDVMYKDINSCVINNGHFSFFFKVTRGSRQGDPLSPYIFILSAEPLAQAIIKNLNIPGIKINTTEYKIGQYADDTFILLDGREHSLRSTIILLSKFTYCSGLKINIEKSSIIWLGEKAGKEETICPDIKLSWATKFTLLGIHFNSKLQQMTTENFDKVLTKIEKIIKSYTCWKLTLLGKNCIIKIIPMFIHILTVLPNQDKSFYDKYNRQIKEFLWGSGKVQISSQQLTLDIGNGGLKMTRLETLSDALKISWIKRIYENEGRWKTLYKDIVSECNNDQIWELDTKSLIKHSNKIHNRFWKQVILAWSKYVDIVDTDTKYYNRPIWNSYFIVNENLRRLKYVMYNSGCKKVINLFNQERKYILKYGEICAKYNIRINILDYHALTQSIPKLWKK